jgi:hypothetical protein
VNKTPACHRVLGSPRGSSACLWELSFIPSINFLSLWAPFIVHEVHSSASWDKNPECWASLWLNVRVPLRLAAYSAWNQLWLTWPKLPLTRTKGGRMVSGKRDCFWLILLNGMWVNELRHLVFIKFLINNLQVILPHHQDVGGIRNMWPQGP